MKSYSLLIVLLINTIQSADHGNLTRRMADVMLRIGKLALTPLSGLSSEEKPDDMIGSTTDQSALSRTPTHSQETPSHIEGDASEILCKFILLGHTFNDAKAFEEKALLLGIACLSRLSHRDFMDTIGQSRLALRRTGEQRNGDQVFQMVRILAVYGAPHRFIDDSASLQEGSNEMVQRAEISSEGTETEYVSVYELFAPAGQLNKKDSNH